ncbi:GNAT family N-acetyltransferase [Brevibacillus laterosporus]|uniref:GNAT family N-acetyltransferase n=1 Tax=Brevibacillus laterosporus TaxID=1465 RepID=A0A502J1Q2_BRELA|nr:GNAT family N-acetyltransferase [Brevibacillus laterosporus]QDX93504.1 GNAT family N-acetyltransferase [Brevibacillus laterosporus]TPG73512.1 GNAT family N-acetyltransferase [Brevibacillus laterosporus]TPG92665.1 GNAT family N-acetyltransferase [Brevibacillus laterosporus]
MIYELPVQEYDRIKSIFYDQTNHPIIWGIINGNNQGKVYVDDLKSPRTALIWAKFEIFLLGGDKENESFNKNLEFFIRERIAPESLQIGDIAFQLEFPQSNTCESKVVDKLINYLPKAYGRCAFTFNEAKYRELTNWHNRVPSGYCVEKITPELIDRDKEGRIREELENFWVSPEVFFKKGIGYCTMQGNKVISSCLSVYASEGNIEIGINTYDSQHRNKGLATLAARAVLDECLQRGVTPHWKTENFRYASIKLANKLGFENRRDYKAYYFFYRDLDNFVSSAYYHLKEFGDILVAKDYVNRAKGLGELEDWHCFHVACGFAVAGETATALAYLEQAVDKGWRDTDDVRFENDLKTLHGSKEWEILNKRLFSSEGK